MCQWMRPYLSQMKPMDEAILIPDEDSDEPSGIIFQRESDEDNVLVNEVNEIEDLNDFKESPPPNLPPSM